MDWDLDGRLDIIVGDREGNVYYFRRLPAGGVFLVQEPMVNVAGRPIEVGLNSSPSVVYWNGDSLPDLVVGKSEGFPGGLLLYMNEGSAGQPVFNATDTVTCGGEPIPLYAAYPDFGDMDGDGLEDMIVGNTTGRIPCFINSGTHDEPLFVHYEDLRADGEVLNLYTYVRPSICDWNQDSVPDLLASTYEGTVRLYLGIPGTGMEQTEPYPLPGISLESCANPVRETLRPVIILAADTRVTTMVYSVDGRMLAEEDHGQLRMGTHELRIDVGRLPEGVYMFTCAGAGDSVSGRFVVAGR
ncbi:MAG: T9SS type A sorting domain-containing protein [Candidatus Fermentibacteraceae bacterium]|nr:T9SS type A sorting domain-containing protein [Candidatus Fermentibacteraceae bacterium]MBN2609673.1 T9SS type A sorting domain-containing protein [Candidatus Fermentibacteraceae bacterium]